MNAPRPTLTPSRLNVGGYGVTLRGRFVRIEVEQESAPTPEGGIRGSTGFTRVPYRRPITTGRVTPDGSLTLQPEPWAARHYRRAVMGGAGVYRAGLWAFLAAGQGLQFPTPESGARVEPHTVRVRGFADIPARVVTGWGAARRVVIQPVKMCTADEGTVTADGLTLSRGEWQGYALQEAMSKGAGVFLAGLWAHLGGTREGGAALGVNGPQVLEQYTAGLPRLNAWRVWRTSWRYRAAFIGVQFVSDRRFRPEIAERHRLDAIYKHLSKPPTAFELSGWYFAPDMREWTQLEYLRFVSGQFHSLNRSKSYTRYLDVSVRLAVRLAAREHSQMCARRRPPMRAPRPLYAHPRPPAAPLAPPAL